MLSVAHEDAWAGFVEVHQALVAVGATSVFLPVHSHLLQVLEPDVVADALATFSIDSLATSSATPRI